MFTRKSRKHDETEYEVTKTDEEWREQLSPDRYAVLRRAGTEPAWSGELLHVDGHGVFRCAGCGAELFDTDAKFESGTGWPSFDRARVGGDRHRTVRPRLRHDADRDPVRPLRWPPGPRVPRRAHRHRAALLRQLALAHLRARRRGGPGRGLSLRQPLLDGAEQRLEAGRLGTRDRGGAAASRRGRARRRSRRPRPSGSRSAARPRPGPEPDQHARSRAASAADATMASVPGCAAQPRQQARRRARRSRPAPRDDQPGRHSRLDRRGVGRGLLRRRRPAPPRPGAPPAARRPWRSGGSGRPRPP